MSFLLIFLLTLCFFTTTANPAMQISDGFGRRIHMINAVDQFTINYNSSTPMSANTTTTYTQTLPTYNNTITSSALTLCGYSWTTSYNLIFNLTMTSFAYPTVNYAFTVNGTATIYQISYFLLVKTSTFSGVRFITDTYYPSILSMNIHQSTLHTTTANNVPSVQFGSTLYPLNPNELINLFIVGFSSTITTAIDSIKVSMQYQMSGPQFYLVLRGMDNQVQWIQFSIVIIDKTLLQQENYITYYSTNQQISTHFGITVPAVFDTFDYCIFGIFTEFLTKPINYNHQHYYYFQPGGFLSENITSSNATSDATSDSWNVICLGKCQLPLYVVDSSSSSCILCNVSIPYCLICVNNITCTACEANVSLLNSTTHLCVACDFNMTGCCKSTSSATVCLACTDDNAYYLNTTSAQCQLCSTTISYCLICSTPTDCLQCTPNTSYLNSANHSCRPCSYSLQNCVLCTDSSTCFGCLASLTYLNASNQCSYCNQSIASCAQCSSSTTCTVCYEEYYLNSSLLCACKFGWPVNSPHCTAIPGCVTISTIDFSNYCTSCDLLEFQSLPVNNTCVCKIGTLVSGICTDISGCISMRVINGVKTCLACNISLLLKLSSGTCICRDYYEFQSSTNTCNEICGDGHLINYQCDDGNFISGDGCSINCKVQSSYQCYNGSISNPSTCIFQGQLSVLVRSISKDPLSDKGFFQFQFSPNISLTLSKMKFTNKNVILDINSTFEVTAVAFNAGVLSVQVSYTKDLEGLNSSLQIFYDQKVINMSQLNATNKNNTSLYQFQAVSDDVPLRISTNYRYILINCQILQYLSYAALVLFVIGSCFRKMLGVQCLYVFQLFFFYQIFIKNYSQQMSSFHQLKFVTNWYTYPAYQTLLAKMVRIDDGMYKYVALINRLDLNYEFTENTFINNVIQVVLIAGFCVFFLLKRIYSSKYDQIQNCLKAEKAISKSQEASFSKNSNSLKILLNSNKQTLVQIEKMFNLFYSHVLFPLFIGFLMQILASSYFSCMRFPVLYSKLNYIQTYKPKLNAFFLFISFLGIAGIIGEELKLFTTKNNKKQQKDKIDQKLLYCIIFLLFMLLQSIAMMMFVFENAALSGQIEIIIFTLFAVNLAYFIFLIAYRPYSLTSSGLHNFSIILNQFIILTFSGIISFGYIAVHLYGPMYLFSDDTEIMILFGLVGLLILVQTLVSVRIGYEFKICYENWKHNKDLKVNLSKQQISQNQRKITSNLVKDIKSHNKFENIQISKAKEEKNYSNRLKQINLDDRMEPENVMEDKKINQNYLLINIVEGKKDKSKLIEKELTHSYKFLEGEKKRLRQSLMSYLKRIDELEEKGERQ